MNESSFNDSEVMVSLRVVMVTGAGTPVGNNDDDWDSDILDELDDCSLILWFCTVDNCCFDRSKYSMSKSESDSLS